MSMPWLYTTGGLSLWICFVAVTVGAEATADVAVDNAESSLLEHRLTLLDMVPGMPGTGRIDVGLDWKYGSAVATKYMRAPRIAIGYAGEIKRALHVDSLDAKETAIFTSATETEIEIASPSLASTVKLVAGDSKWEVKTVAAGDFTIGVSQRRATLRVTDGKIGINTDSMPTQPLHLQSSKKGEGMLFQGNFDGKAETLVDAMLTLESSKDHRGRGLFLPHRGQQEGSHAWFAGVPAGGNGFSIGNSQSAIAESEEGGYTKQNSKLFITPDGRVGVGTVEPVGRLNVVVPQGESSQARKGALSVVRGSIRLDFGHGLYANSLTTINADKETISLGAPDQSRNIKFFAGHEDKSAALVVQKETGWVGIGGVDKPSSALHMKGSLNVQQGSVNVVAVPKDDADPVLTLESKATAPAALSLKQGGKMFMTISAGENGGMIEMANKADLVMRGGRVGIGVDTPTEMLHLKGGNLLLDGQASVNFGNAAAGTQIFENQGLHLTSQAAGRVHVDDAQLVVGNTGSASVVTVKADSAKHAKLEFLSGTTAWQMQSSEGQGGSLTFSHHAEGKAASPLFEFTKTGKLAIGEVETPQAELHVKGSALMEEDENEVYSTVRTKAEASLAGIKVASGASEWQIETLGTSGGLQVTNGGKKHLVISSKGAVGVGVESPLPGTSLHVRGPSMFNVGSGKVVISTPNSNPGLTFFNNDDQRVTDIEAVPLGLAFMRQGFVGFGTREPQSRLHLHDDQNSAITLSRNNKPSSTARWSYNGGFVQFGSTVSDGLQLMVQDKPQLTVHSNGNLGLHTEVPQSDLQISTRTHAFQVAQNSYFSGNAHWDGAKFKYTTNGGGAAIKMFADGKVGILTGERGNANMPIESFSSARFVVSAEGQVGIGTEKPNSMLHVASTDEASLSKHGGLIIGLDKVSENLVLDKKTVQARSKGQAAPLLLNPHGGDVKLLSETGDAGSTSVFTATGSVGLGTDTPIAKLHLSEGPDKFTTLALGDSVKGSALLSYKGSMLTLGFSKARSGNQVNSGEGIVVKADGGVGIGTSAPEAALDVKGDVHVSGELKVGGKQVLSMMEQLMEENQALKTQLEETKEMMMTLSANLRQMRQMQESNLEVREH